jgi:arginyl-tRNA synthetase
LIKKDDEGNYFVDLSKYNTPNKIVLRKDLTSIYVTQDIYLAKQKFEDFNLDLSIYCVGSEQKEYFKQLFAIMQELNLVETSKLEHLPFGMISLPSGKMKSREGTVVDTDDLVSAIEDDVAIIIKQKWPDITDEELKKRKKAIALSAIKYFILSYDCRKDFVFNPEQSISFEGNSGPYLLYTYARICSLLKKINVDINNEKLSSFITKEEEAVGRKMTKLNFKINLAVNKRSPHY